MASRGLSLRGQFLPHLVERAVKGIPHPTERMVTALFSAELLKMAKA